MHIWTHETVLIGWLKSPHYHICCSWLFLKISFNVNFRPFLYYQWFRVLGIVAMITVLDSMKKSYRFIAFQNEWNPRGDFSWRINHRINKSHRLLLSNPDFSCDFDSIFYHLQANALCTKYEFYHVQKRVNRNHAKWDVAKVQQLNLNTQRVSSHFTSNVQYEIILHTIQFESIRFDSMHTSSKKRYKKTHGLMMARYNLCKKKLFSLTHYGSKIWWLIVFE